MEYNEDYIKYRNYILNPQQPNFVNVYQPSIENAPNAQWTGNRFPSEYSIWLGTFPSIPAAKEYVRMRSAFLALRGMDHDLVENENDYIEKDKLDEMRRIEKPI